MSREMKDSGVEWIGLIPRQSKLLNTKYILEYTKGKNPHNINTEGKGLPYIGASDIEKDGDVHDYANFCENENLPKSAKDDVLVLWDGARAGLIGTGHEGYISSTVAKISPRVDYIYKRFWWWYLKGMQPLLYDWVGGTTIPHMKREFIYELKFVLHSINDQAIISDFLDSKVMQIDSIIVKTKSTIEDYKLLKQSIITEAVTKGLDKNVEMKDSGIKWIGKVPRHWETTKVKNVCRKITDGAHISPETEKGIYNFISTVDIKDDGINFSNCLKTSKESYDNMVRTGCKPDYLDVLISKDGTVGRSVIVDTKIDFVVASSLVIMKPDNIINPYYLNLILQSDIVQKQLHSFMKGAGLKRVSIKNNTNVYITLPPLDEQIRIYELISSKINIIDLLMLRKLKLVGDLEVYKKSLIYEYVTGKKEVK